MIDDFGELRSGSYLKVLVRILGVISLCCGLAAGGFYFLYDLKAVENQGMKNRLDVLEKKVEQLTREKEILMARLVMAGEKPVLETAPVQETPPPAPLVKSKKPEVKKTKPGVAEAEPAPQISPGEPPETDLPAPPALAGEIDGPEGGGEDVEETGPAEDSVPDEVPVQSSELPESQTVMVEKFSIGKAGNGRDLKVRFDIRNVKKGPGEISGRIFLVLKPETGAEASWIVVPKGPLSENGVPSVYKRGQYFSISRFKPVMFTISRPLHPERLKTAAIYIFDDKGQLIFKDVLGISLEEQG